MLVFRAGCFVLLLVLCLEFLPNLGRLCNSSFSNCCVASAQVTHEVFSSPHTWGSVFWGKRPYGNACFRNGGCCVLLVHAGPLSGGRCSDCSWPEWLTVVLAALTVVDVSTP